MIGAVRAARMSSHMKRTAGKQTAARAALPVILVPGGSSSKDELAATGELVVSSLSQLPELLPERAPD